MGIYTWTDNGTASSERNIGGLSGLIAVADNTSGIAWQITNIHGDVVAMVNNNDVGFDNVTTADEYGVLADQNAVGATRYAWLGSKERAADNPDGIVLMGVRLYNPTTGRFLSPDPVPDGSANAYDYVNADPTNSTDLDGRRSWNVWWSWHWWGAETHITASKYMTKELHEDVQGGSIVGVVWAIGACNQLKIRVAVFVCDVIASLITVWADHEINSAYVHGTCFEFTVSIRWFSANPYRYWFGTRHGRHCKDK